MDVLNVLDQSITDKYAIYNGDCMEVMPALPEGSVHLSVYSPPFAGLYQYSSSERDLSNSRDYDEFMHHYELVIDEIARVTMPGRMTAVHCMDIPRSNTGRNDSLMDFPGDIIRLHERLGWRYVARYHVWKEPLTVRNRTMTKGLAHATLVDDSTRCSVASADYLLIFRRAGDNPIKVEHPTGLHDYAGERQPPAELLRYRGWEGKQTENRFSHWVWRQYADAFWDDVRLDRVPRRIVEGLGELVRLLGEQVLSEPGELDRRRVARLVFSDPVARERVNAITHPRIRELAIVMADAVAAAHGRGSEAQNVAPTILPRLNDAYTMRSRSISGSVWSASSARPRSAIACRKNS